MRKILLIFVLILSFSCEKDEIVKEIELPLITKNIIAISNVWENEGLIAVTTEDAVPVTFMWQIDNCYYELPFVDTDDYYYSINTETVLEITMTGGYAALYFELINNSILRFRVNSFVDGEWLIGEPQDLLPYDLDVSSVEYCEDQNKSIEILKQFTL